MTAADSSRQNARQVFGDASAGDVRHGGNTIGRNHFFDYRPVAPVGAQQLVADFALEFIDIAVGRVAGHFKKQLAGQRIAVGVQAGGRQAQHHIARLNRLSANNALALHHSHDEPRQIIFAIGIEIRHLGGFPADEGASVLLARGGDLRPPARRRADPACR